MAGAGTAALELIEQVEDLDTIVAPIGGGGLIAGTAMAAHGARPGIQVIGVEPEDADDTRRSLEAGERLRIPPPATVADGLRITMPGALTFPVVQRHVAAILTASEEEILEAVRFALLRPKLVIEPSGAVPLAVALAARLPERAAGWPDYQRRNIDPALLGQLWGVPAPASAA